MMPRSRYFRNVAFPLIAVFLSAAVFAGCGKKPEETGSAADRPEQRTDSDARTETKKKNATSEAGTVEMEQLDAEAMFDLGLRYQNGDGVERDFSEATKWYLEAAENGHALAQMLIARQYATGEGVDCDLAESARWYREAAENGIAAAQCRLGQYYFDGIGVEQDYGEAAKWFRLAAENDYSTAQFNLGGCYALGLGVEKDKAEAAKWFRMAAENGERDALDALKELESLDED